MFMNYGSHALAETASTAVTIQTDEVQRGLFYAFSFIPIFSCTVLYFKENTGVLKHGPLEDSPPNAFFVFGGAGGRIGRRAESEVWDVVCQSDKCRSLDPSTNGADSVATVFDLVPIERGFELHLTRKQMLDRGDGATNNLVGLRANAMYLSAEADGRITLNKSRCLMFEHFRR